MIHIEEHCVLVGLLHDVRNLNVQIVDEVSRRMVYDFVEAFKTHASFTDVSVEQSYANYNVGQFA